MIFQYFNIIIPLYPIITIVETSIYYTLTRRDSAGGCNGAEEDLGGDEHSLFAFLPLGDVAELRRNQNMDII